jgi:HPt (histidine-containing phosphotransfer) domain-containing protein
MIPQIQDEEEAEAIETIVEVNSESFGTIDLSDVKPIHFDFQLDEAANDLSLPVELIEEFVVDFIDQAHVETDKMLEAYEKGDLDAIQKIGHLLKGTSSNLRINPLADTLYKIQFCEESSQLETLIKEYWAHFLSFENQIKTITN